MKTPYYYRVQSMLKLARVILTFSKLQKDQLFGLLKKNY